MPKVSIVVPVYKVEAYLKRCVDSLTKQTLHDIEIILVDDGSPDRCPMMCDGFATEDERIRVVHKTNGGLSSARNAGLRVATGDYVGFVDSDDTVATDMYEKMLRVIEIEHVDFVMSDYIRVSSDGESYLKTLSIPAGRYDKAAMKKEIFPQLIMGENVDYGPLLSVWHCLYRTSFLRDNGFYFDEEVRWSEDNIFSAIVGYRANSFYYMKGEGLYCYYQNPGTITTAYRPGAWDVYCTMNRHLRNEFEKVSDFNFGRQLNLHMIYYACNCIGQALSLPKKGAIHDIRHVLDSAELRTAFADLKLPKVPLKLKIQLQLMKHRQSFFLYSVLSH